MIKETAIVVNVNHSDDDDADDDHLIIEKQETPL